MLFGLSLQVIQVDIALIVALYYYYFHTCHHRAGRISAVGGGRNQGDGAMVIPIGFVIGLKVVSLFNQNAYRKFILLVTAIGALVIFLK